MTTTHEIRDTRDHKYAYGFDFDVMHPYMIKSFEPFFRPGTLLELGSFKGDFTQTVAALLQRRHLCRSVGRGPA